jgi:hypothetical protein
MAITLARPSAVDAQGCLPVDDDARNLLAHAIELVTDRTARGDTNRAMYNLIRHPQSEVQHETGKTTCAQAAKRFHEEADPKSATIKPVHVVRAGDRYIVTNPQVRGGEFNVFLVFDRKWRLRAAVAG